MNPTQITLPPDGRLQVDAPYHPEIVRRLKELGGEWDKPRRVWYVAAIYADRLLDALPKASYSPDALDACWEAPTLRAGHFVNGLARLGITVRVVGNDVVAEGNVSPAIVDALTERADAVIAWLADNEPWRPVAVRRSDYAVVPSALEAALVDGMHNAAATEQRQREVRARVTRRRMLEQAELWDSAT